MDDADQSVTVALGAQDNLLHSLTCLSGPQPLVVSDPPHRSGQAWVLQCEREVEKHMQERKSACWTCEGLLSMSLDASIHSHTLIGKSQNSFVTYSAQKGSNVCPLPSGPWTLWAWMGVLWGQDSKGLVTIIY